ncbi:hypothetical protein [Rhizobium sp. BK376]|uniref:hypothetical protein n=1 Tax=Rhizobium sp. BK376 TaxID=2512149 RepID=UPI0010463D33|nr:hypothetical protein [Rhizobium sp. BK376]TCR82275.1 hypothetical protein EV561_111180 [Rhizobium sp. BK376]
MLRICDGIRNSPKRLLSAYGEMYLSLGRDFLTAANGEARFGDLAGLSEVYEWTFVTRAVPVLVGKTTVGAHPSIIRDTLPISDVQLFSESLKIVRCTTGWYRLADRVDHLHFRDARLTVAPISSTFRTIVGNGNFHPNAVQRERAPDFGAG